MSKLFSISKNPDVNYLASIQRIEKVESIPNADRLQKTTINGYDMIISKDVKVGDIVVYFPVECCICEKLLSTNNLYERAEFERNSNADEVKALIERVEKETDPDKTTDILATIKEKCGFFNSKGRVRILKLRGEYSQGFICGIDALLTAWPELNDLQYHFKPENFVGEQFDTILGDKVCWKYVPEAKERNVTNDGGSQSVWKRRMRTLKKFDRLVPGTFAFHYDTTILGVHFKEIGPDDIVTMTVKVHGTSGIFANIPVNRKLTVWEKVKKFFGCHVCLTEYGNVYSSRSVIKNQYINKNAGSGFYDTDIWTCVNKVVAPFIDKDMTVYGEIVGYLEGTSTMIQKNHDYGCAPGEWRFMPYRITTLLPDGSKYEWNVTEVIAWTKKIIVNNMDVADKFVPMTLLYHGPLKDLYPDVPVDENWHTNVLELLKTDAKPDGLGHRGFCMELREPLCRNKVPREGIVFRIDNDVRARAWKLKTKAHYGIEAMQHDDGEADIEETA